MRYATLLLTLILTVGAWSTAPAQTGGTPDEAPPESERVEEGAERVVPSEEGTEGEEEGARPATTKKSEEEAEEDSEPVDTEPTMFTSCSQVAASPEAGVSLLFLLAFAAFRRR